MIKASQIQVVLFMLKIAIVDDEYAVAAQTERRMAEICKELMLEVQIELFGSGEEAI